ncbi:MAG: argD [Vampirovibrio sp.]|jgi:predicted acetylornithine/succinylornithine family transaminase|nr:argD [Vampirovibrio sp.]
MNAALVSEGLAVAQTTILESPLQTDWLSRGQQAVMNTYQHFPVVLEKGEGCYLWDIQGKRYLDFVSGIAVNSLGHAHPALTEALATQCAQLMHCSNLYWNTPQIELAETLTEASGFAQVFFCNSGAESIEAALKLARKYSVSRYNEQRTQVIAMQNSFHGRTYGAMSLTGQGKYHAGYAPLVPDIVHVPINNLEALNAAISEQTCAIVIEPIQGEGGIKLANPDYLKVIRSICDEQDILLIFDEVQTGIGRTGKLFAFEWTGVRPDIITLAKGLGGGFPIGAMMASAKVAPSFNPGDHASTFGGNPLACTAAKVVLNVLLEQDGLLNVMEQGAYLSQKLTALKVKYPEKIVDVRGMKFMQGIEFSQPVAPIVEKCMAQGLLVVGAGPNVIRLVPPLIATEAHIDEALAILESALSEN